MTLKNTLDMEIKHLNCERRYPTCVSTQEGRDLQQYQSQAKQLFRKLNAQSPERCTLETGDMNFQ